MNKIGRYILFSMLFVLSTLMSILMIYTICTYTEAGMIVIPLTLALVLAIGSLLGILETASGNPVKKTE
jgi:hypothetical protein